MISRARALAVPALLLAAVSGLAQGQDKPAVLVFDASVSYVAGARGRVGFDRLPAEGELAVWVEEGGRRGDIAATVLGGLAGGAMGAAAGAGLAEGRMQALRNDSIAGLRRAMERDDRLRQRMEEELRASMQANGYAVSRTVQVPTLRQGAVSRVLSKPADGVCVAVQTYPAADLVTLSWDDRHLLLSLDVRIYRHNGSERMPIREVRRRSVRFVGQGAPAGVDALAYWSDQDGAAFIAQLESGLQQLLPMVWDETLEVPQVPGKEVARLQVGGTTLTFPGRVWKQEGGYAYLYNKDGGITVVATQALPVR